MAPLTDGIIHALSVLLVAATQPGSRSHTLESAEELLRIVLSEHPDVKAAAAPKAVESEQARDAGTLPSADSYEAFQMNGRAWAANRWRLEVENRPMVNVHRRTLDDTWRQVIRYFEGDPDKLCGPSHDQLLGAASGAPAAAPAGKALPPPPVHLAPYEKQQWRNGYRAALAAAAVQEAFLAKNK